MCMYVCTHYIHMCVYVCIHIHTHVHTYVCVHICTYTCMYTCVCVYMYIHMYVYVCTCIHTHIHTYIHVCTYMCVYVYIHTYVCTYTHAMEAPFSCVSIIMTRIILSLILRMHVNVLSQFAALSLRNGHPFFRSFSFADAASQCMCTPSFDLGSLALLSVMHKLHALHDAPHSSRTPQHYKYVQQIKR